MLSHVWSATVVGVESVLVRVEAHVVGGLPGLSIVGLPQGAVREGKDRVQAALRHGEWKLPPRRITVNLAPADLRKDGSALDLPMAVALILTLDDAGFRVPDGTVLLGELGLDGSLRPVRGALAVARRAALEGMARLVVPVENAPEAAAASAELEVLGASSLLEVVRHLKGAEPLARRRFREDGGTEEPGPPAPDLCHVRGQKAAKRALEVAAAGGHNLLMSGPPGSGKTFLARCLPGILPRLTRQESLEVTTVHSVAGLLPPGVALLRRAPFRAPHHTVSPAGLAGGGAPLRPGEVSLAHRGVLFLDELPEFARHSLESLRQPMEDGVISVVRARERARFPARFALVAAMNPCPCGFLGHPERPCECDPGRVVRYRSRVSGPLRDRIDLHIDVPPVPVEALRDPGRGLSSAEVAARVQEARARQARRYRGRSRERVNARIEAAELQRWVDPGEDGWALLEAASRHMTLSPRGVHRVIRVARTVADLEGSEPVTVDHLAEALQYRLSPLVAGKLSAAEVG